MRPGVGIEPLKARDTQRVNSLANRRMLGGSELGEGKHLA
jgi:hypothetical protein